MSVSGRCGTTKHKAAILAATAVVLLLTSNPRPSKIIEVRNKLNDGDSTASSGIQQINQRRKV
jgi:hypothetical protein